MYYVLLSIPCSILFLLPNLLHLIQLCFGERCLSPVGHFTGWLVAWEIHEKHKVVLLVRVSGIWETSHSVTWLNDLKKALMFRDFMFPSLCLFTCPFQFLRNGLKNNKGHWNPDHLPYVQKWNYTNLSIKVETTSNICSVWWVFILLNLFDSYCPQQYFSRQWKYSLVSSKK